MKTEIEAKFCRVDHESVRQKLREIGAVCESPMRLLRRVVAETSELQSKNAYLRVRDQGDKTALTYKQFDSLSVDGAKEVEVEVSDFDAMAQILQALEPTRYSYQESRREVWKLDGTEIVLDEWPWLDPYIEIEGESRESIESIAIKLGFDWSDAVFGDVMAAYRQQYPQLSERDTVGDLPQVRFDDPLPDMLRY